MSNKIKADLAADHSFHGSAHITEPDDNIFLELGFSPDQAEELQKQSQAKIDAIIAKQKSDFSLNLTGLRALAIETFGSKSKADYWLNKFHRILGNTPIATAESASGLIEVEKILNAISYGGVV